jgi:hypothetical protein
MAQPDLAAACSRVADLSVAALDWIADPANAETVGAQTQGLTREFRRAARRARRLAAAADRNMSVGVFGPSQAGKSFLVSVLARPQGGKLTADFDAPLGRKDFISEINPPGEGESTGLVTRFTMRREPCPPGFPVRLRLLSEADIVRVLANTFLMDGDQSEPAPTPEEIDGLLTGYARRKGTGAGMSNEDVWDIREYFDKGFSRSAYVAALKPFWEEASEIAPALSLSDRAQFLAILWGRHALFSEIYVMLATALAKIGHAGEVFAAPEALSPRHESIIDVKMLAGLDGGGVQSDVALRTPTGVTASLPKPVVTALTAELVIAMAEQPWDIFAQTDLLDFPGARARFTNNLAKTFATAETPRKDTFLRGKVAYLFDRYVAEQELTSMLLCIPPSNMEVTDLPGLVETWVTETHGATPAERARTDCILFFVFTKFDMHLTDNAATGTDPVTRYERRIASSMTDPFGKLSDSWVNEWADGRPFDNSFWLRNPNYPAKGFIRYDAALREIAYEEGVEHGRLAELRAGCLSVPAVRKHFAEPERAWDAAMALNDGGVSFLVERLRPVCRPEIKARQVRGQLGVVCRQLHGRLAPFHVSDDIEKRLEEKRAAAGVAIGALNHVFSLAKFGELLEGLFVDPDRIADRILRVPAGVHISAAPAARPPGPAPGAAPRPLPPGGAAPRPLPPGGAAPRPMVPGAAAPAQPAARAVLPGGMRVAEPPAPRPETGAPAMRMMTREAFQAESAMQVWVETLRDFARRPDLYASFGVPPETADDLVAELIAAARRFRIEARLAEELARLNFALRAEAQSGPVATVAGEAINRFVARLGVDDLPPNRRPRVQFEDGAERPAFEPKPLRFAADDLPEHEANDAATYLTDWIFALYQLYEDNAKSTDSAAVDIEQNSRLGAILKGIDGAAA